MKLRSGLITAAGIDDTRDGGVGGVGFPIPPSEMLGIERAIQVDGVKQHGRLNDIHPRPTGQDDCRAPPVRAATPAPGRHGAEPRGVRGGAPRPPGSLRRPPRAAAPQRHTPPGPARRAARPAPSRAPSGSSRGPCPFSALSPFPPSPAAPTSRLPSPRPFPTRGRNNKVKPQKSLIQFTPHIRVLRARSPPLGPEAWPVHASLPLTYHPVPDIA